MRTYRLPDRYCRLAAFKRALFAFTVLLLAGGAGLLLLASRSVLTIHSAWPLYLSLIIGCLFVPMSAWRMRRALGSYRLTLSENYLTQSMHGVNDVTVGSDEVTEIIEKLGTSLLVTPATRLVVRTAQRPRCIIVLDGVEEYVDLRVRLARWREIKSQSRSLLFTALQQAAFLPLFACPFAAFYSSNPYVVVLAALAFAVSGVVCLWMMLRSPHVPAWAKVLSWIMLAPITLMAARIAMIYGLIKW